MSAAWKRSRNWCNPCSHSATSEGNCPSACKWDTASRLWCRRIVSQDNECQRKHTHFLSVPGCNLLVWKTTKQCSSAFNCKSSWSPNGPSMVGMSLYPSIVAGALTLYNTALPAIWCKWSPHSWSCNWNPEFGQQMGRHSFRKRNAAVKGLGNKTMTHNLDTQTEVTHHFFDHMRYAMATAGLRLMPLTQCINTTPPSILARSIRNMREKKRALMSTVVWSLSGKR